MDLNAVSAGSRPLLPADPTAPPSASDEAAAIKRRAGIACRRCRRMRSKCIHDKGKAPCQACEEAGIGEAGCIYPTRGQPDEDREYRHPRARKTSKRDPAKLRREIMDEPIVRQPAPISQYKNIKGADVWDSLPPLPEIVEGVVQFTHHYFQLGFIPKDMFLERLLHDHRSISVFFLLSILSVSARLTPALVARFGTAVNAAETFMNRASAVALDELYKGPDLERCQAFYLLSIAQQGSAMKTNSSINMAVALRMATLMQLHREETYCLEHPTKELIVRAESARRTLWMLHSQDNLHASQKCPVSLAASDITALLPGSESDFENGQEPRSRAALEGTPPAVENPGLVTDSGRSLFSTLIQTHHFWGDILRRALNHRKSRDPWEHGSEFFRMSEKLRIWEGGLPLEHQWSAYRLKEYKSKNLELAYLAVTMATRLCNIVLRKAYLDEIISDDKSNPELTVFWGKTSLELFGNVRLLFDQIDTQYCNRQPEDGYGAQMSAFCIYTCGFLASYLFKYPNICPDISITTVGPRMLQRCMSILSESQNIWPLAARWYDHLLRFSKDAKNAPLAGGEGSMSDSREPIPHALHPHVSVTPTNPLQPRTSDGSDASDLTPGDTATQDVSVSPQASASSMYIDPSLRMAMPHPDDPPPSPHLRQHPQSAHGSPQNHLNGMVTARGQANTGGLDLLIEASSFDTHPHNPHTHAHNPHDPHQHHQQQHPLASLDGSAVDPTSVATFVQQHHDGVAVPDYYHAAAAVAQLGIGPGNDGYENELQYCVSDGVPQMHNWVGGQGLYY